MYSKIAFPWFYFLKIVRLAFIIFVPTLLVVLSTFRFYFRDGLITHTKSQAIEALENQFHGIDLKDFDWTKWCQQYPYQEGQNISVWTPQKEWVCNTPGNYSNSLFGFSAKMSLSTGHHLEHNFQLSFLDPVQNKIDHILFARILPLTLICFLLFLYLFYRSTLPLGNVLAKVNQFKVDIPFQKNLELLYKNDKWAQIEEALNEADHQLKIQLEKAKTENEKITTILESINDDIIAIDPYESVLFYNTNFKKHFMNDISSGEIIPKLWHKIKDEKVLEAFRKVLKTGERLDLSGLIFHSPGRPNRFYDINITPLKNTEGIILGALGVFYDVTEFKLTEQMRVDFVANVSHEIRTPLTSIKGFTQLLQSQKQKVDSDLHPFLDKIISNTERMISLFNDLLNLSVIESKELPRFEEIVIDELISEVISNIKTNYPNKNIVVEKDIQHHTFMGDERLLGQVISNLIDNACKYSGEKPAVKVSTFAKDKKSYIVVADNGPGISKEHLQRIFERFYRIDSSREASRGTGLGLSIAKHIISKHKGKIWAESEEAQGTTFVIELPLA